MPRGRRVPGARPRRSGVAAAEPAAASRGAASTRSRRAACSPRRAPARTWSSSSTATARRWGCRRSRSTTARPRGRGRRTPRTWRRTATSATGAPTARSPSSASPQPAGPTWSSRTRAASPTSSRASSIARRSSIRRTSRQAEDMFFHETPPHDGHRKNILKPWHKTVGIGVAQPVATPTEIPVPCFAQEFVDPYGTYAAGAAQRRAWAPCFTSAAPSRRRRRSRASASRGSMRRRRCRSRSSIAGGRTRFPRRTRCTGPPGFQTPIPVKVDGSKFAIDVPLSDGGQARALRAERVGHAARAPPTSSW